VTSPALIPKARTEAVPATRHARREPFVVRYPTTAAYLAWAAAVTAFVGVF
jgi:hypothetical protein